MSKVCLAYSGGLDTSVCIPLLREKYGFDEVIAVTVDVGIPGRKLAKARRIAKKLADKHYVVDAKEEFVENGIFRLIKANAQYEGYVLGTAMARVIIAEKVVGVARKERADAVAHGCTGKGNDQLRFDTIFRASGMRVIAPIRELNMTREEEMDYASKHGIKIERGRWSVDENLWSRSIEGGELEDPWTAPPEEIYEWTVDPSRAPDPEIVEIEFDGGVPVSLNGRRMKPLNLIVTLNKLAGKHGIGRSDLIEDRVLGFKARENYEHPAATVLLKAHADLEQLVLTRNELKFKSIVDMLWSELVYSGMTIDPLYDALNAFIDKTQERVCGKVRVKLCKGSARIVGRCSPHSLYTTDVSFDSKISDEFWKSMEFYGMQAKLFRSMERIYGRRGKK